MTREVTCVYGLMLVCEWTRDGVTRGGRANICIVDMLMVVFQKRLKKKIIIEDIISAAQTRTPRKGVCCPLQKSRARLAAQEIAYQAASQFFPSVENIVNVRCLAGLIVDQQITSANQARIRTPAHKGKQDDDEAVG